jgi:hypothetical protein
MNFHKHLIEFAAKLETDYGREDYITEIKLIPKLYERVAVDLLKEQGAFSFGLPTSVVAHYGSHPIRVVKDPEAAKEDLKERARTILRLVEANNLGKDFIKELMEVLLHDNSNSTI